jgi:hypothetical protein
MVRRCSAPLSPCASQHGLSVRHTDLYNNIPGQKTQAIWFDVFVPYERAPAPPGRYSGAVEVTWKGGQDRIRVMLDVWDFALPNETHLPGDIWNGSMKSMRPEEEMAYYQFARQHRFVPLVYAYQPALRVEGSQVTLDWSEFDRRLSPISTAPHLPRNTRTGAGRCIRSTTSCCLRHRKGRQPRPGVARSSAGSRPHR